jgi:Fe-S cluster assembly protein SufD
MARGLPKPVAEAMLLEAFVDEATDRVESEPVRVYLTSLIGQWLSQRGAA